MIGLAAPFSFLYFSVETLFHLKIRFIRLPKVLISGKWVRASATLTYGQPKRWKFGSRELGVMSEEATVYGFGGCVSSSYRFRCTHNMTYGENFIGARLRVPRKTRTEVQLPPPLPPPPKKKKDRRGLFAESNMEGDQVWVDFGRYFWVPAGETTIGNDPKTPVFPPNCPAPTAWEASQPISFIGDPSDRFRTVQHMPQYCGVNESGRILLPRLNIVAKNEDQYLPRLSLSQTLPSKYR